MAATAVEAAQGWSVLRGAATAATALLLGNGDSFVHADEPVEEKGSGVCQRAPGGALVLQPAVAPLSGDKAMFFRSGALTTGIFSLPVAFAEPDKPVGRSTQVLGRQFIADAAEQVAPAVVNITVEVGMGPGMFGALLGKSSGSGVLVDGANGLVLTNAHVVADAAGADGPRRGAPGGRRRIGGGNLTVATQDGRTFEGEVVSLDSLTDLAVVRVKGVPQGGLPAARLGTSASLRAGEWVVALGSPLHLQNSVTAGIISCVDRKGSEIGLRGGRTDYIQTDAAINQGNSGGPLVNLDGEVIGINAMKAAMADGVSFAIPIDTAKSVMHQLLTRGRVVRPYVGLKMLELNPSIAAQLRERDPTFPKGVTEGILIPQVIPDSPADKAGLQAGDVITSFGGKRVDTVKELMDILGDKVGEKFEVCVKRPTGTASLVVITEEASIP